jgi:hypothetical protein
MVNMVTAVTVANIEILAVVNMVVAGGWGNDHSHHYWWHGQYYPDCDWVLDQYYQQWVWNC